MPVTALLGTKPTRSPPIRAVVAAAKREFDRGNWGRGCVLLGLVVLARLGRFIDPTARRVSDAAR
ncbi:hypothetical protein [Natrinema versiforme]|uniref:Uncharacterized protein n=1 Tax=Natrinema versiforme TaxID=88724 RepID=A0A4V1FXF8_9EURY|nr:hypothetical protein [Natrinema versiforme]QCS40959.1 hypothetical protein FEJ81_00835 [Natrinema versiforme]